MTETTRLLLVLAAGTVASVSQAQICTPFTDVAASSAFCADIQWMYNRGITTGCTTATTFCPSQFVRRDQMAAFMSRLADNAVFQQGGNAFGATAVLGTTDARPVEIVVDGERALRVWNVRDDTHQGSVNVLGGHPDNVISRTCSGVFCLTGDPVRGGTIAGGGLPSFVGENRVTDSWGTIGGGAINTAGNDNSDSFDAEYAVVAGGRGNTASSSFGTVGGGIGNVVSGAFATIPGGWGNIAAGKASFAAGFAARAAADGCFVWSDQVSQAYTTCNTDNLFLARATGGFRLRTNTALTTGCAIAAGGGAWSCSSSRDLKKDIIAVDTVDILDRVARLPVSTWRYRDETSGALHLGPTAEDFREAFGLGDSSADIGLIDGQGVALAAIQGLNAKLEAVIETQQRRLEAQAAELAALRATVARIVARQ